MPGKYHEIIFICFVCFFASHLSGQKLGCISSEEMLHLDKNFLRASFEQEQLDLQWSRHFNKEKSAPSLSNSKKDTLVVGVVFHVVTHSGAGLSDDRIMKSFNWLNDAFANQGFYDPSTGVETCIRFCLTKRDENENSSSGIYRLNSPLANVNIGKDDRNLKNLSRQNPHCFANIWIVDEISSSSSGSSVAGYATLPSSHGSNFDGIVLESRYVGTNEAENVVLIHEMGHYLGLYHTFQGGCENDNCSLDGDLICDTPPDQSTGYTSCPGRMNTCNTDANSGFASDQPDMISNYMDYSRFECYSQFTENQKDKMRYTLNGRRRSLLNCSNCLEPCTEKIEVNLNPSQRNAFVCDTIYMVNNSINADGYSWYIDGVHYSDRPNPYFVFNESGEYEIQFHAFSADGKCSAFDTLIINIECRFEVELKTSIPSCIEAGQDFPIELFHSNNFKIRWYIDQTFEVEAPILDNAYAPGAYRIKVVGDDGKCKDSVQLILKVGCIEICNNSVDDDGDGLYDCFDPDCCEECPESYYNPCASYSQTCVDTIPFSIKGMWTTQSSTYNPLYTMLSGDIDNDGEVEIVTYENNVGIRILGFNGRPKYTILDDPDNPNFWTSANAIGDVDRDGDAEIFFMSGGFNLQSYDYDGSLNFISEPITTYGNLTFFGHIHIKDVNLDGQPEVIVAYNILDAITGEKFASYIPEIKQSYSHHRFEVWDILPDSHCKNCSGMEMINGTQIISISDDLRTLTIEKELDIDKNGVSFLVDWDLDGDLDIASVLGHRFNGEIVIWDGQTDLIIDQVPLDKGDAQLVVGNFDRDPEPEMALVFYGAVTTMELFDNNLTSRWELKILEPSTIVPVCFDFQQDGVSEIIIRDQGFLKIIDTQKGEELFRTICRSLTGDERPLIADITGDGHAELVVSCRIGSDHKRGNIRSFEGRTAKWPKTRSVVNQYSFFNTHVNDDLTIPAFAQNKALLNNYQNLNSSMTQVVIPDLDSSDYSVKAKEIYCNGDSLQLVFELCRNHIASIDSLSITFYDQSPDQSSARAINTLKIPSTDFQDNFCLTDTFVVNKQRLDPEICILINNNGNQQVPFNPFEKNNSTILKDCDYINNFDCISSKTDFKPFVLVRDTIMCNPHGIRLTIDSNYQSILWSTGSVNNWTVIDTPGKYWVKTLNGCDDALIDSFEVLHFNHPLLDLPDTLYQCESGVVVLRAGPSFESYQWNDFSTDSIFTAIGTGIYFVKTVDACGNLHMDTAVILPKQIPDLNIPDSLSICQGDTMYVQVPNYNNVVWNSTNHILCEECKINGLFPDSSRWYYVNGINDEGCIKKDSIFIHVIPPFELRDTITTCPESRVYYRIDSFGLGEHRIFIDVQNSCDSFILLQVLPINPDTISKQEFVCFGDSLLVNGEFLGPGVHPLPFPSIHQCDSLFILTVHEQPEISVDILTTSSCALDGSGSATILSSNSGIRYSYFWSSGTKINDSTVTNLAPGNYKVVVENEMRCSSEFSFVIDSTDTHLSNDTVILCINDSTYFEGEYYTEGNYVIEKNNPSGCDTIIHLEVQEWNKINVQINTQPSCYADSTGQASIHLLDNSLYNSIDWSGGVSINDTSVIALPPGKHHVTLLDKNGCTHTYSFEIPAYKVPEVSMDIIYDSCSLNHGIQLHLQNQLFGHLQGHNYQSSGSEFFNLNEGTYNLTIVDSNDCTVQDTIILLENTIAYSYELTDTIRIGIGDSVVAEVFGDINKIHSIEWIGSSGDFLSGSHVLKIFPTTSTSYQVAIFDSNNCLHILDVVIILNTNINIFIPNIFSPNGDNLNDRLKIFSSHNQVIIHEFEVYSRWGELIYRETEKPLASFKGWDGTFNDEVLNPAVFVYRLTYSAANLKSESLVGSVTLQN